MAERDIAAFVVAAARKREAHNQMLVIGGPSAVTFLEVFRAYEQALARTIDVRSVAPAEPIPGLPEPVWGMAAALESFGSPIPMEELARAFEVPLTLRARVRREFPTCPRSGLKTRAVF